MEEVGCPPGFELDINESKTRIYSADFRFADAWPADLSIDLETALDSSPHQKQERLRAALERAFSMAVSDGDDGILKYVIRYLDRHSSSWSDWDIGEPFLKRSLVHFGHTTDYVARVIVWRHLAKGDLDLPTWSKILAGIVDSHGRIGNDSEVCWATYACAQLRSPIALQSAENIVRNCGALSMLSILNCAENGLVDESIFDTAHERMRLENASGAFWPVLLEWKSRQWPRHAELTLGNEIVASLAAQDAVLFDINRLPVVFNEIEAEDFNAVERAIEDRPSMYDEDASDDDDDYIDDDDDDYDEGIDDDAADDDYEDMDDRL